MPLEIFLGCCIVCNRWDNPTRLIGEGAFVDCLCEVCDERWFRSCFPGRTWSPWAARVSVSQS